MSLSFGDLAAANLSRCQRWHPGFPTAEAWTTADWSNATAGEAGELAEAALALVAYVGRVANTVKKIRRYETGTSTSVDKPLAELLREVQDEAADVACYLDLLATKVGFSLADAVVRKFNAVSERQGFPERLPSEEDQLQQLVREECDDPSPMVPAWRLRTYCTRPLGHRGPHRDDAGAEWRYLGTS